MDITKLEEARLLMIKLINDNYPNVDTRKGTVIHDLLVSMAALGYASISEDIASFEEKMYLQQIVEDPASADEAVVDGILSNFYISRKLGGKAKGLVKLEVSESRAYYVDSNSLFQTIDGLNYYTTTDYSILPEDLFQQDDNYYFFVEVQAEEVGSSYMIAETTAMQTSILSGSLVSAEAFNDFDGGIDKESNQELLDRAPISLGTRALSSRQSITTILQEQFPEVRQITVIGYNDREMQRDKNNVGFKIGGKADIYVRTIVEPLNKTIEKTTDANGEFTLTSLENGEVPVLRVRNIALKSNPLNTITDFTVTAIGRQNPHLYRFSIYEQLKIETSLIEEDIIVTADYIPFIESIQEYVDSEESKYIRSDTLIRSYMPCFISMTINYRSSFPTSEIEPQIKSKLIEFINTYDQDILYVSKIMDELHNLDIININLPLEITGTFYLPDGNTTSQTSENKIQIESDFDLGISEKTYRFFIVPSDIGLNKLV